MFEYEDLKELARASGVKASDLIVLSSGNDPFYAGAPWRDPLLRREDGRPGS